MDAVRQPCLVMQPAAIFEIIERSLAEGFDAKAIFVMGFGQMRMQAAAALFGERCRVAHQFARDREWRAGGEGDFDQGLIAGFVMGFDGALAVFQDRVMILHDAVRRQAAVFLAEVHRAAIERHAHAKRAGFFGLNVHGVFKACGEDIVMIGRAGDAGHHQFGQGKAGGKAEGIRFQSCPNRIKRFQPGEQFLVDGIAGGRGSASGRNDDGC